MIIRTILEKLNQEYIQEGTEYKIKCPFHNDKSPSLSISSVKLCFHCWSCKASGNLEKLIQKLAGKDCNVDDYISQEALLKSKLNRLYEDTLEDVMYYENEQNFKMYINSIENNFIDASEAGESFNYLKCRGFSKETIKKFNLKFCIHGEYANRIIMPLYKNGIYIGFNSRLIGDVTKSLRYRFFVNKLEISNFIYNFHKVNTVIIVEGIFDLMWLYENGIKNVISFMSASASNGQLLALQPFKNLIFMYDNDNGGKSGVIKNSKFILGNMPDKFIYNANLPDKKDVNESSREELYNSLKKLNRIKNVPV